MVDNGAIQCGFCTPGIVMSLVAESTSARTTTKESAIAAAAGNICRCTGYKSIQRAAEAIAGAMSEKDTADPVRWLVEHKQLPEYFLTIPERLSAIPVFAEPPESGVRIAGGTDMMVRHADELAESDILTLYDRRDLKGIRFEGGRCIMGAR